MIGMIRPFGWRQSGRTFRRPTKWHYNWSAVLICSATGTGKTSPDDLEICRGTTGNIRTISHAWSVACFRSHFGSSRCYKYRLCESVSVLSVYVCVCLCVSVCMDECMNEWVSERAELIKKWIDEWVNACTNERINEWPNEWTSGVMRWMNEWVNACMNEWNVRLNAWMYQQRNVCPNELMNGMRKWRKLVN